MHPQERTPAQELAQMVQEARFEPVRLVAGYDMGEVDHFLDEVVAAGVRGEDLTPLVNDARFTSVRLREGYSVEDVDAFLQELLVWNDRARSGGASAGEPSGSLDAAGAPEAASHAVSEAERVAQQVEALVQGASLRTARWRAGYEKGEVDRYLAQVVTAARSAAGPAAVLHRADFAAVRGAEGYRPDDVDALVARLRGVAGLLG